METQGQVINIGQVAAIWISPTRPDNVQLVWYDTVNRVHRVYDPHTGDWKPLNPQIISDAYRSTLVDEVATSGGLPLGQFYNLLDSKTLAIAITTTKIFYSDTNGNYIVDDLQAHKQYYINSDNLYIDGTSGVWDTNSGQLRFSFTEQNDASQLDKENDYISIRHNDNGVWSWIKTKIKSFVSSVGGNSIKWNSGFYFNFSFAIDSIKDVSGGIVSKGTYDAKMADLDNNIQNQIPQQIASALNTAKGYTDDKVTNTEIYDKQLPTQLVISQNPDDTPAVNTKLIQILGGIYSWIAKLKLANNINVGTGFDPNGVDADVVATDSVMQAIEKLVFKTKNTIRINEDSWHSGSNIQWIIRNDTLFLRLQGVNWSVGIFTSRCWETGISLGDDFLQYIDVVFAHLDWMYITPGIEDQDNKLKQKWIYLCDVACTNFEGTSGRGVSYSGVPIDKCVSLYLCLSEDGNGKRCILGTRVLLEHIFYNSAPYGQTPVFADAPVNSLSTCTLVASIPSSTILALPLLF